MPRKRQNGFCQRQSYITQPHITQFSEEVRSKKPSELIQTFGIAQKMAAGVFAIALSQQPLQKLNIHTTNDNDQLVDT